MRGDADNLLRGASHPPGSAGESLRPTALRRAIKRNQLPLYFESGARKVAAGRRELTIRPGKVKVEESIAP